LKHFPQSDTELSNKRARRVKKGLGAERLQIDFLGKSDGSYLHVQLFMKQIKREEGNNLCNLAVNVTFTQMSAIKGIKIFGEEAMAATIK